ncbi:MAG TPA: lipid-A-disaccharide synthase [Bacteroides sp.]|nr:lipid-A-disaccharide synthase [Bacteroides sp.]
MRYFIIAGEASGDLHASSLMKELKLRDPEADFRFMGGDLMGSVSDGMVMHYRETGYMMLDVVFHLGKILGNMRKLKAEMLAYRPDAAILVDYPGFNLRMARAATRMGLKVFYYISPKVWAWNQQRVKQIKKYTHRLFVIFPFEEAYFHRFGMQVEYYGNPLVDAVSGFRQGFLGSAEWKRAHDLDDRPVVALLAGSRKKEIEAMLPVMVRVAKQYPGYQFVVAGAPSIDPQFYGPFIKEEPVMLVQGETYPLLASAYAAMVTSGTATLEAALFEVPQLVLYKTGSLAYALAKRMIKVNFISLANLIYGDRLVEEIIQKDLFRRADRELSRLLDDADYRESMRKGYREVSMKIGGEGVSGRIAERMVELLQGTVQGES